MRIRTFDKISELQEFLRLEKSPLSGDSSLKIANSETELFSRRLCDFEVLSMLAANQSGIFIDIGFSEGVFSKYLSEANSKALVIKLNINLKNKINLEKIQNIAQVSWPDNKQKLPESVKDISLAIVDGQHTPGRIYAISIDLYQRLKPGGFIIWHNFSPLDRYRYEILDNTMQGVEEFINRTKLNNEILYLRESWLGILKKPGVVRNGSNAFIRNHKREKRKRISNNKIKILVLYDVVGWAWYQKGKQLQQLMPEDIEIDLRQLYTNYDHREYDYVLIFDAYLLERWECDIPKEKLIVGCSNERMIAETVEIVKYGDFRAGFVNNLPAYEKVIDKSNFYCCQNGVDTDLFFPANVKPNEFAACWVGNSQGRAEKGTDIIEQACLISQTKLYLLDRIADEKLETRKLYTPDEVRDKVYHQANVYICASQYEGTPNPALEALACGLPVIATRVGNMPEIIVDGVNGYLVERDAESIASAIQKIKSGNYEELSRNARNSIMNGWTWRDKAQNYVRMFRELASADLLETVGGSIEKNKRAGLLERSIPLFNEAAQNLAHKLEPTVADGGLEDVKACDMILSPAHKNNSYKFSIIIPTFNRPDIIYRAVFSVLSQGHKSLEIIIVNDCGVEIPRQTLENLKQQQVPITVIRHKENHGLGASRNSGIMHAKGEWLIFLDDDDELAPQSLQALESQISQTDASFIFGDHIRRHFKGEEKTAEDYHHIAVTMPESLMLENPILCGSFTIKADYMRKLRGYREDLKVHEDYNLHIRAAKSTEFAYVKAPIMIYNCHQDPGRMNVGLRLYWFGTSALNHSIYRELFNNHEIQLDQRRHQYKHLERALKEGAKEEEVVSLVFAWWDSLVSAGLKDEVYADFPFIEQHIKALIPKLEAYTGLE